MSETYDLYQRGCALLDDGHNHAACEPLQRARDLEPAKVSIRIALARALFNSGRVSKAAEEFEVATDLAPADGYAHFGLGLSQARLGRHDRALGHLKLAVAMRPDRDTYTRALSRLEARLHR